MMRKFKIHLRADREPIPSFGGHVVFKAACRRLYLLDGVTDHPELVECRRCQAAMRGGATT